MDKLFNILLATDYSETVMNAERYAVQLARETHSSLRFLHVFQSPEANQTWAFDAEKIDYNPVAYETKKLNEHVLKLLRSLRLKPSELSYDCIVREAPVSSQVKKEAEEISPYFI